MSKAILRAVLEFSRKKTDDLLAAVAKEPDVQAALAWRPGPGRAHIAWQLTHLAATDDRHLNVRMRGGQPAEPEYVRRFAGGSTVDDDVPALDEIRRYLAARRQALLAHLDGLDDSQLSQKPNADAPWTYQDWFTLLGWHEGHHQGQAHLTLNLYRNREQG